MTKTELPKHSVARALLSPPCAVVLCAQQTHPLFPQIAFISTRDIKLGDALLFSYNKEAAADRKARREDPLIVCNCGDSACTGNVF